MNTKNMIALLFVLVMAAWFLRPTATEHYIDFNNPTHIQKLHDEMHEASKDLDRASQVIGKMRINIANMLNNKDSTNKPKPSSPPEKPAQADTDWKQTNRNWYIANKAPGSSNRTFWLAVDAKTLDQCKSECSKNNTLQGNPRYVGCSYIRFKPKSERKCLFSNSLSESAINASKTASVKTLNVPTDGYGYVNPNTKRIRNYIQK